MEQWSEYELSDGTVVKLKPNIVAVMFKGFDERNMPLYDIGTACTMRIEKWTREPIEPASNRKGF